MLWLWHKKSTSHGDTNDFCCRLLWRDRTVAWCEFCADDEMWQGTKHLLITHMTLEANRLQPIPYQLVLHRFEASRRTAVDARPCGRAEVSAADPSAGTFLELKRSWRQINSDDRSHSDRKKLDQIHSIDFCTTPSYFSIQTKKHNKLTSTQVYEKPIT